MIKLLYLENVILLKFYAWINLCLIKTTIILQIIQKVIISIFLQDATTKVFLIEKWKFKLGYYNEDNLGQNLNFPTGTVSR